MVNLHYVPAHLNATVVSVVNVGWKTTLSLLNHYSNYGSPQTRTKAQQQVEQLSARVEDLEAQLRASRQQSWLCARLCPPCSTTAAANTANANSHAGAGAVSAQQAAGAVVAGNHHGKGSG
jgi:hypothetical protein